MDVNSCKLNLNIYRSALEISKIGVWEYNELQNKIIFSKTSKAIIGFENDDTFGNNIEDWNSRVHPQDLKAYKQDYQNHIKGITETYSNKHRVLCNDGSYKWVLDQGKIINNPKADGYIHFIGTHTDITEQVENETKVSNAFEIASKQKNKLQNFAHIVTHNLKQHSGNFESILDFYDEAKTDIEKEEFIDYLKEVSKSLNRTIKNLNQIVLVQSKKENEIEELNVWDFIEETIKFLDVVLGESKAIVKNEINPEICIYFNRAYLESIIQNLLSNAIKYKHPDRCPVITIKSEILKNSILFTIQDNGIGIDLDKYGNDIFGLYKTFHRNDDAEGVGLYLIKNQIEAFGARISVESKVNVGTTFIILIPN